jgi:hypothetical protein
LLILNFLPKGFGFNIPKSVDLLHDIYNFQFAILHMECIDPVLPPHKMVGLICDGRQVLFDSSIGQFIFCPWMNTSYTIMDEKILNTIKKRWGFKDIKVTIDFVVYMSREKSEQLISNPPQCNLEDVRTESVDF